ncbi:chromosome segregation ATPase [Vibrio metschnikovii]|uniref:PEGA domain-containing protein n=1 Tax=Vibrio metschnikovii TaxID=28172 RepID=UPI0001B94343|nr:PEGA domain-containing protein [Vibrio metschnikovii]EEX36243.1 chromosome segregation ATPase [Vibrio metschnikovii CIP 69.14]SUP79579.1 chromosome segregation ATPase [Vibrio metschnikovii]SUQ10523.1 chromosome segregation ATPase [Vibrio metschnikovii]
MIKYHLPALLLALSPLWVSASVFAEEVTQVDPVAAIDEKITIKQSEIDTIAAEFEAEGAQLQQLKNEQARLKRESDELNARQNRAKSALDKQYNRLLEDPDTDLVTFQQRYQQAWADVKQNQSEQLINQQAMTESDMRLSQMKQRHARLKTEFTNLQESKIDARVKRLEAELRQSRVLEASFRTTCSTSMTLGECANQGQQLTRQRAVNTFREQLLDNLTESVIAKQNLRGVELNIHVQESQVIRSGFEGNNEYFTHIQAQLQARPEAVAACKLLNVSSRYCLKNATETVNSKNEKQWANVTIRSDQYHDSVTINGIQYGSTPVEVVLPAGRHQISVTKDGFETYNQTVTINGNDTIWVRLRPSRND